MEEQTAVFDRCQTAGDMHIHLQRLIKELLPTRQQREDMVPLNVLADLPYPEMKQYPRPVFLVSEMCRLLFKLGDKQSLQYVIALSHSLYAFKCSYNESWYIAYLYKGIAQIGLKLTDIGIKNVSIGMAEHDGFSVIPVDQALGYWAMMSAAIANRNLKLALTFAEKWHRAAQDGKLDGEIFRAKISLLLLHLLYGDREICVQDLPALTANSPSEWREVVAFLEDWTQSMTAENPRFTSESAGIRSGRHVSEPYPLFLGVDWHDSGSPIKRERGTSFSADFSGLCDIRRNFCNEYTQSTLSTEEIETCADMLAQWELPRPLCELEAVLKERERHQYFRYNLTRLLGKPVLQKILSETPLDPNVVTRDEAIIWVMDVRKFSALSEKRTPEEIFDLLNPVFKIISEELESVGGAILEFIGDSLVIVFNTFKDQHTGIPTILWHTIRCLQRIYVLNAISYQSVGQDVRIGVGIHTGPIALGYLGGLNRCHLTVLGNTINLAARLESASKELPGEVIVSAACFANQKPDIWAEPGNINFSLRNAGEHRMRNIETPVHLFGLKPLLRYWVDFVPMGFVAHPEKGVVYLDTGNSSEPGIIDHHFEGRQTKSACESLLRQPELLRQHVEGLPASQIEFRVHAAPDFDCAATLYAAQELLDQQPRDTLLKKLAEYTSLVDQAKIPRPEWMSESLYGIFRAHQMLAAKQAGADMTDRVLLEAGLRVIDAAMYLLEEQPDTGDLSCIFRFRQQWFPKEKRLLKDDLEQYAEDLKRRSQSYAARVNGIAEPVIGLWLDHPQSIFFRIWAWTDPSAPGGKGYPWIGFDLSQPGKNRFVIGVAPESGKDLNGLGQWLEAHETRKRKELGKERPIHPIRYPADNSDPWYFGQGHNYAVIDSPGQGTILTAAEVQKIHQCWQNI